MITHDEYRSRVDTVRKRMSGVGLDALVVLDTEHLVMGGNVRYLTGFYTSTPPGIMSGGPMAAIITPATVSLSVNPCVSNSEVNKHALVCATWVRLSAARVGIYGHDLAAEIKTALDADGIRNGSSVGLSGMHLMAEPIAKDIRAALSAFELVEEAPGSLGIVERLKAVKSPAELELCREAARISDAGIEAMRNAIKVGKRLDLAVAEAEYSVKSLGAGWTSTIFIGAMGRTNRFVWGVSHGAQAFQKGDMLMVEVQANYEGYFGQVVRAFVVGSASEDQKHVLDSVSRAFHDVEEALRPGVKASELFAVIANAAQAGGCSIGSRCGHGMGYGMADSWSIQADDHTVLTTGSYGALHPIFRYEEGVVGCGGCFCMTETGAELLNTGEHPIEV